MTKAELDRVKADRLPQEMVEFLAKKGTDFINGKKGVSWTDGDYEEFAKVLEMPSLTWTQMGDIIKTSAGILLEDLDAVVTKEKKPKKTRDTVSPVEGAQDTVSRVGEEVKAEVEAVKAVLDKADAAALKAAYDDLNSRIENLTDCAEKAIESLTPLYVEMRSLLSERGSNKASKQAYKDANLPTWYQWSQSFAKRCQATVRTCNRHAKLLTEGVAMHPKTTKPQDGFKPLKPAEQRRLAKAAVVGTELVKSYENNGSDLPELVREYKSLAISPDRLEDAVTGGGTDYEGILKCLLRELLSSPKVTLNQEGWNIVRKAAKAAGIPVLEEREKAA